MEKAAFNAFSKIFQLSSLLYCFFHVLKTFKTELESLGFKNKLAFRHKDYSPEFGAFWNFISGIMSSNYSNPNIRRKVRLILEEYEEQLPFANDVEKVNLYNL